MSLDRALGELLAGTLRSSGLEVATATALDGPVDLAVLDEHAAAAHAERARVAAATTIVFRTTPAPPEEIARLLQRFDAYVAADEPLLLAWLVTRVAHAHYRVVPRRSGRH